MAKRKEKPAAQVQLQPATEQPPDGKQVAALFLGLTIEEQRICVDACLSAAGENAIKERMYSHWLDTVCEMVRDQEKREANNELTKQMARANKSKKKTAHDKIIECRLYEGLSAEAIRRRHPELGMEASAIQKVIDRKIPKRK